MIEKELKRHQIATKKLEKIKERAFKFIKDNLEKITEYQVSQFILKEFKKENLITDDKIKRPIVATRENTSFVHYFPEKRKSKIIGKNNLVLIDIWARLNEKRAPFADLTFVAYTGKNIPLKIKKIFKRVIEARDLAINFIKENLEKKNLPQCQKIDKIVRDYFKKFDLDKYFLHNLGHSLGFKLVHGRYFRLGKKAKGKIKTQIPFTIEPGLYFKNSFGIRSEIDCYINSNWELEITSFLQKELIKL